MTDLQARDHEASSAAGGATWEPPGPGQWALDLSHTPPGATPIGQHLILQAMPSGFRQMFADLGAPLDTIQPAFVNGHFYTRVRPLISPDKPAVKLPPPVVLKLVARLHPEMRRRNRRAARTLREQPWREVIVEWHAEIRPRIVAANLAIQDVDLDALAEAELVEHVRARVDHAVSCVEEHFRLHGYDMGPIGLFLHQAGAWGIEPDELLSLLEGASPSTTAPLRALCEIRSLLDDAGVVPTTLDAARDASPTVRAGVDRYLAERGAVLFSSYDIDGVTLGERPELVLASILSADVVDTTADVARRTSTVREAVPAAERSRFDELLRQARDAMDLRDDNGPVTVEWPLGLVRLGLLAIGRRMVAAGTWSDVDLAVELRPDEIDGSLFGNPPSEAELVARRARRAEQRRLAAPAVLGPAEPTPPPTALPNALADLVGMVTAVMRHLGMDGAATHAGLGGHGIGSGVVRGRALVVDSPVEAMDRLELGDVLVVAGTTPAYNLVLSLVAGVVTSVGGPMSHAAVLARELGIPAVVGAPGALRDIVDGDVIEVDADAGQVRVVSRP